MLYFNRSTNRVSFASARSGGGKGSSAWPSVLPVLFYDSVKLRYDLAVGDIPSNCVFGELFKRKPLYDLQSRRFCYTQRHNEIRDLWKPNL